MLNNKLFKKTLVYEGVCYVKKNTITVNVSDTAYI